MNDLTKAVLNDGVLKLDWTRFRGIRTCETFGRWQLVDQRVPVGWVPALGFGAALHEGLDVRQKWMMEQQRGIVSGALSLPSMMEAAAEACFLVETKDLEGRTVVESVTLPDGEWRTAGRAKDVLGLYCQRWTDDVERYEILESEKAHEKRLGVAHYYDENGGQGMEVIWQGRIDGIWRNRANGQVGFKDTKHTSQGDFETEYRKHKRSGQFKGYSFLTGIREAIVDTIIVRKPVMKETRATKPRTEFARDFWTYTEEQIEEWRLDTLAVIGSWLTHLASGRVPQNDQACFYMGKPCPYLPVCEQSTMKDRLSWLMGGEFKRNTWSPMIKQPRLVATAQEREKLSVGEDY